MNKIRVVILEDEKPALRLITGMLSNVRPNWMIEFVSGSIHDAINWFKENLQPDLLFLDIHLSDGNSFTFLEKAIPHCPIIFTTAYDEYAIRAFSVNSIDYLLKPFDEKRLEEAILKFENRISIISENEPLVVTNDIIMEALKEALNKVKQYRTRFLISSGSSSSQMLQVEEIAYFYSINKVTIAICKNREERIIDLTLDKLSEQLNPDKFFRANRQFILNIDSIRRIEPFFGGKISVTLTPASHETVTVSKEKVSQFKQWLNF